jgi:hypothetical protein
MPNVATTDGIAKTQTASDSEHPADPTADQFLTEIFAGIAGRVVLCEPNPGGWFDQQFWSPGLCASLPPACWYFTMSTARGLADDGRVHRRYADLERTGCLVLDDAGTRLPLSVITLEPSWVLYTSTKLWDFTTGKESPNGEPADNHQVGYILDSGMRPTSATLLLRELKKTVLGPLVLTAATQPYRLPGSVNTKKGKLFIAKLVHWVPERRYLPSEIARHYDLGPKPRIAPRPNIRYRNDGDPVWSALRRGGYVLDKPHAGWWPIRCPWEDEHGDHSMDGKPDSGIGYRPRQGGLGAAFKCFHTACLQRGWLHLFDKLVHELPAGKLRVRR